MNDVSREFSSALFSIAVEENKVELFEEQLALLKTVFEENPDYAILLSSPNITKEEKDSLLEEAFGLVLSDHLLSFLGVLSEQNKFFILHDCIEDFFSLALNYRNVTTAKITSAVELSEEQKSRLLKKLEALTDKKVSMSFEINPQLIGGLTLEVDGKVIDASLLNQIRDIKEVIVK